MQEISLVPLAQIRCNPHQPRREWDEDELADLAASIDSLGIIHPPVVQRDPDGQGYELVSGERRVRAARLAHHENILVVVRSGDVKFSAQAALAENVQRVDLNPIEVARALRRLMEQFGYRQEQLAAIIGKKRSTVANYLRLLSLPSNIQEGTSAGEITMGHAKAILSIDNRESQQELYRMVVQQNLSVRAAEQAAARLVAKKEQDKPKRDLFLQEIERLLMGHLGTKVSIQGGGKKGRIAIDYHSLEDLDRILELLGMKQAEY